MSGRTVQVRSVLAPLVVAVAAGLLSGCQMGTDDEMARTPEATVTQTQTAPTPEPEVPQAVPAGADPLPAGPVWAQDSVLHVGDQRRDLAPHVVEAFVRGTNGIYFLEDGDLWFTDLELVRDTGLSRVRSLQVSPDAGTIRVVLERRAGPAAYSFDTASGARVQASAADMLSARERLGEPAHVVLTGGRAEVRPTAEPGTVPARIGPGAYGVVPGAAPLSAFETGSGAVLPLRGTPTGSFELTAWTGADSFYGVSRAADASAEVVECVLPQRRCRTVGRAEGTDPLVLGTGR